MLECKRSFERFNLPVAVSFRPTYGATEYTVGVVKNISDNGLALETEDFSFIKYENLEINLQLSQSSEPISLSGNVIWKKRIDDKSIAGVKLKALDAEVQNHLHDQISTYGEIPADRVISESHADYVMQTGPEIKTGIKESKKKKRSQKKIRKSGFTKQYFNGGSKCKVTFRLPVEAAPGARKVTLVGDFNDWNSASSPMKQVTRGDYLVTIELSSNTEYRFKYLIDEKIWENDWFADKYVSNDFGSDDSVVVL